MNLILDTDSYKFSHYKQYPKGVTKNYAYYESRGGDYQNVIFFGLQYLLKEYLSKTISADDVYEAKQIAEAHGEPFNLNDWSRIVTEHNGYLPIRIKAVREGTLVPTRNVLMTVENTDPQLAWVTSFVETMLSRVWYPCTVATKSWHIRQVIHSFLKRTSDNAATELNFKLHDFGSRGSTSRESAAIGGAAHLLNFLGTDTVVALRMLQKHYGAKMPGFSIPATEHSVITAYGRAGEADAYRAMLRAHGDGPIFACVSDSYNLEHAVRELWGKQLKEDVLNMKATLVVRPDSGYPPEIVVKVAHWLEEAFGAATNRRGFKVLNKVRIIQGDGMDEEMIYKTYEALERARFSAENLAVGMGGGLLQKLNRDTCRFAYKTSWMEIAGKGVDIYKDPATDPSKKSKKGRFSLVNGLRGIETVPETAFGNLLETVWEDGLLLRDQTLDDIRELTMKDPIAL